MKIIYSWDHNKDFRSFIKADIQKWRDLGYEITEVMHRDKLGISTQWPFDELEKLYNDKNQKLLALYDRVRKLAETQDVFIVAGDPIYHPEFIESLKNIYTVFVSGDDPESSDYCSKPYVSAFDHSFSLGVNFDKNTKITEKFLEWGAKRADWWPYGVTENMYNPLFTEADLLNKKRDIDLVFVGTPSNKVERLLEIKKAFPQMKIYGRGWNWRTFIRSKNKFSTFLAGFWRIKKFPSDELAPLYQRCKIGINVHMSFGPSNQRVYQLPANGVMQICDCKEGLGQIFEIGKEVVAYHSTAEAIDSIRYYLQHDEERKKIASAGFQKIMHDYKRTTTFSNAIKKIKIGMVEDGIKIFKDGTPITI